MKTKLLSVVALFSVLIFEFISCTEKSFQVTPKPVTLDLAAPASLGDGGNLGRVLFYDTHLSVNNSISCATCHKQALAFSDNKALSNGFENRLTARNTLPIQNLSAFPSGFPLFWDGRENMLQTMVLKPILNHVEMGMEDEAALVERVRNVPYYHDLFQKAFNNSNITSDEIGLALSEFIDHLTSVNTRFDHAQQNQNVFTALEQQGQQLFTQKYNCSGCHQLAADGYGTFGVNFLNIGLDLNYPDPGRQNVTHDIADAGKFKIPNLRNVALTAPYMHDGRFATLDDVLNHYSHGIADHPNLDSRLKGADNMPIRMNISDQEKTALIAFLNTLTDFSLISNPDLSNPFH
jgi:cytochrome c peroxidase